MDENMKKSPNERQANTTAPLAKELREAQRCEKQMAEGDWTNDGNYCNLDGLGLEAGKRNKLDHR
jgi:hypothetical protein